MTIRLPAALRLPVLLLLATPVLADWNYGESSLLRAPAPVLNTAIASPATRLFVPGLLLTLDQQRFGELASYAIDPVSGQPDPSVDWRARQTITAASRGAMLTWNPALGAGVSFGYANLTAEQRADLNHDPNVVSWLQGNPVAGFRDRSVGLLGDLQNTNLLYVGREDQGYASMPDPCFTTDGQSYDAGVGCTGALLYPYFVSQKTLRPAMVYFGANDGQLHGLRADNGAEQLSYIPAGVYASWQDANEDGVRDAGETADKKLHALSQPSYTHRAFVDGKLATGDVFWGGNWRSLLVGGLGAGGRSVFALDVTDTSFTPADVQWEFSHPELGYTFSKPVIGRMRNGQWVAIFGNGADSGGDRAQLLIVNLLNGNLIKKIDTAVGDALTPNGMMSVQVLRDANRAITAVYGADLQGNIWHFDVSGTSAAQWQLHHKVFAATDTTGVPQPVTGEIALGSLADMPGTMVYFGTGKYFETTDNQYVTGPGLPVVNTFYGVLDQGTTASRSSLVQQSIGAPLGTWLPVSTNAVNYSAGQRGWYINLAINGSLNGMRFTGQPVLHDRVLSFTAFAPFLSPPLVQSFQSMLLYVDPRDGSLLDERVLDTNNDGKVDDADSQVAGMSLSGLLSDNKALLGTSEHFFNYMATGLGTANVHSVRLSNLFDADLDGVADNLDADDDNDGVPDDLDLYPRDPTESANSDGDALGDNADPDDDNDGVPDDVDAWPYDPTRGEDSDSDGVQDTEDNCPIDANVDQLDFDMDFIGDACDEDDDNDGVPDDWDSWPYDPFRGQDFDADGLQDSEDNCPLISNPDQLDMDADELGDACDWDADGDGVDELYAWIPDNCSGVPNPDQQDADGDLQGDACDQDDDNDGVPDEDDEDPLNAAIGLKVLPLEGSYSGSSVGESTGAQ